MLSAVKAQDTKTETENASRCNVQIDTEVRIDTEMSSDSTETNTVDTEVRIDTELSSDSTVTDPMDTEVRMDTEMSSGSAVNVSSLTGSVSADAVRKEGWMPWLKQALEIARKGSDV